MASKENIDSIDDTRHQLFRLPQHITTSKNTIPPQAGPASLVAGSVFGFLCCLLAGGDAFLKFRGWREGRLAQGERRVTSTSSNHQTTY